MPFISHLKLPHWTHQSYVTASSSLPNFVRWMMMICLPFFRTLCKVPYGSYLIDRYSPGRDGHLLSGWIDNCTSVSSHNQTQLPIFLHYTSPQCLTLIHYTSNSQTLHHHDPSHSQHWVAIWCCHFAKHNWEPPEAASRLCHNQLHWPLQAPECFAEVNWKSQKKNRTCWHNLNVTSKCFPMILCPREASGSGCEPGATWSGLWRLPVMLWGMSASTGLWVSSGSFEKPWQLFKEI